MQLAVELAAGHLRRQVAVREDRLAEPLLTREDRDPAERQPSEVEPPHPLGVDRARSGEPPPPPLRLRRFPRDLLSCFLGFGRRGRAHRGVGAFSLAEHVGLCLAFLEPMPDGAFDLDLAQLQAHAGHPQRRLGVQAAQPAGCDMTAERAGGGEQGGAAPRVRLGRVGVEPVELALEGLLGSSTQPAERQLVQLGRGARPRRALGLAQPARQRGQRSGREQLVAAPGVRVHARRRGDVAPFTAEFQPVPEPPAAPRAGEVVVPGVVVPAAANAASVGQRLVLGHQTRERL